MAREVVSKVSCDRCGKVVEEAISIATEEDTQPEKPVLYVETRSGGKLQFDDLCVKCDKRVESLLKQLRKESTAEKSSEGKASDKKTSEKKSSKKNSKTGKGSSDSAPIT